MIGYFDCYSGVAGDMVLGAMLDAGLPMGHLEKNLKRLRLGGYRLDKRVSRRGVIGGTDLRVIMDGRHHNHTGFRDIVGMIKRSGIGKVAKDLSMAIFETLARAEARVHRTDIGRVHFHEVGAVDSIVDIVGSAIGFEYFGFDKICSSPIPITRGWVRCQHGKMPVPAPATLEILKGVELIPSPVNAEIVTPTGAAIIKTVVSEFGDNPVTKIKKVGYGLGDKHFREVPNSLRLIIGEGEHLCVIETNIDDMNPQIYDYVIERLIEEGALDVTVRPVLMKKRRPAAQVQVLCGERIRDRLVRLILRETTSLGVRTYRVGRRILDREVICVGTKFGSVRMKVARMGKDVLNISPEYEDCRKLAKKCNVPLKEVLRTAFSWKPYRSG